MSYQPGAKFKIGNETIIDLTGDTVTPETLQAGVTAHRSNGQQITGTHVDPTNATLGHVWGTCSTISSGYDPDFGMMDIAVVVASGFVLADGALFTVKFSVNVPDAPVMNVNNTGVKWIKFRGSTLPYNKIMSGDTVTFAYDGTDYNVIAIDRAETPTNAQMGHAYGTCGTVNNADSNCTVAAADYVLSTGGILVVAFSVNVPAAATLNVNSTGAKALYYKGAAITDGIIKSGDKATIIYDGTQYVLLAIDRWASASNPGRGFAMVTVTSRDDSEYPAIINATADANFQETEGGIIALYTGDAYEAVQADDCLSINGGTPRAILSNYSYIPSGAIGADDMAILVYSDGAYHLLGTLSGMWAGKNVRATTYAQMSGVSVVKQYGTYYLRGIADPDTGGYKLDYGTIIVFNLSADAIYTDTIHYESGYNPIRKPNGSGGFEFVTALSAGIHKLVWCDGYYLID